MSNPGYDTDTQTGQEPDTKKKSAPTFAERVNEVVKDMKQNDKGVWELPEDLPEDVRYAAMAEKRLRDTQASFTKLSQKTKALEAEKSALMKHAIGNIELNLTEAQAQELEDLKFEDPEKWRKKMNQYEQEAFKSREETIAEEVKKVSNSSLEEEELERRKEVLSAFVERTGFDINDDVLSNDIPPRITKKLETGKITFEDFLQECYEYVNTGKVIAKDKVSNQPNLNKVGGSGRPDPNAVKEDIVASYNSETF